MLRFRCLQVPSKDVENWEQYKGPSTSQFAIPVLVADCPPSAAFVPQAPMKPGHVARPDMDVRFIKVRSSSLPSRTRSRNNVAGEARPSSWSPRRYAAQLSLQRFVVRYCAREGREADELAEDLLTLDASVNPVTLSMCAFPRLVLTNSSLMPQRSYL